MRSMTDRAREQRARRALRKVGWQGHRLHRSRWRLGTTDNIGGYQLVDNATNFVVAGSRFELDLDDVERWLAE